MIAYCCYCQEVMHQTKLLGDRTLRTKTVILRTCACDAPGPRSPRT